MVRDNDTARQALQTLEDLGIAGAVLFVVNAKKIVVGTLTDGDIRRGILKDKKFSDPVSDFMNNEFGGSISVYDLNGLLTAQLENSSDHGILSLRETRLPPRYRTQRDTWLIAWNRAYLS